jgi:hypothetical protein
MSEPAGDEGVVEVLLKRLEEQRLPRALELKDRVDRGDRLNDLDLRFLKDVLADTGSVEPLLARHPEYQELVGRLVNLYHGITEKALENEKGSTPPDR